MFTKFINKTIFPVEFSLTSTQHETTNCTIQAGGTYILNLYNPENYGHTCYVSATVEDSTYTSNDSFTYNHMLKSVMIYTILQDGTTFRFLPVAERLDHDVAVQMCSDWRRFYQEHFTGKDIRRGFFVPIEDINEIAAETNAIGARCYFAIENDNIKILMVPVIRDEGTLLEVDKLTDYSSEIAGGITSIFNFTSPCPSRCDNASPLYEVDNV